jgi:hypothetical protein
LLALWKAGKGALSERGINSACRRRDCCNSRNKFRAPAFQFFREKISTTAFDCSSLLKTASPKTHPGVALKKNQSCKRFPGRKFFQKTDWDFYYSRSGLRPKFRQA